MKYTIIKYLIDICKFNIVLTNKNYTKIDTKNDKFFFVFNDGSIKYGYTVLNSKQWDVYSVKKMKQILDEKR